MATLRADIATDNASRYLQQLCKHWSHRFAVDFDASHGTVRMTGADCVSNYAAPGQLRLTLQADDPAAQPRLSEVVAEHLQRFAFREALQVTWEAPA